MYILRIKFTIMIQLERVILIRYLISLKFYINKSMNLAKIDYKLIKLA